MTCRYCRHIAQTGEKGWSLFKININGVMHYTGFICPLCKVNAKDCQGGENAMPIL